MDFAFYKFLSNLDKKVNSILALVKEIKQREVIMATDLSVLQDQITETITIEQSAITLIQGLAAQIESLKEDPAALQALADQLKGSADTLAQAVIANTPAAP